MDDWNGMGPLDEKDADERARRAIEASTLGTEAARAVRAQVRPEVSDALLQRVRARLAAEGLPGGAVHPAGDDPGQDQSAVTGGPGRRSRTGDGGSRTGLAVGLAS